MQNLSIFFNILICRLFWDGVIKKGREWNKFKKKDPRVKFFVLDLWCLLRVSEIGQFSFSLTNHKGRFVDFKPVSWSDVYIALDHIWQQFIYYTWQLNIYCWIELTTRNPLFHLSITKIWFDINVFVFNQIYQKGDIAKRDWENNCKIVDHKSLYYCFEEYGIYSM